MRYISPKLSAGPEQHKKSMAKFPVHSAGMQSSLHLISFLVGALVTLGINGIVPFLFHIALKEMELQVPHMQASHRANYICKGKRAVETAVCPQECGSQNDDGCEVFKAHLVLSQQAMNILNKQLPNNLLETSTRYPPHRIELLFLPLNLNKLNDKSNTEKIEMRL